jgi:hypothetical protein
LYFDRTKKRLPVVSKGSCDLLLFIFFHVEENEPKEDARVPLPPARRRYARGTRKLTPLSAGFKQVRAPLSGRTVDARRGTKGINTSTPNGDSTLHHNITNIVLIYEAYLMQC